ncbi:S9 family peptidase [Atopobacter sp. AH10]|uniref:S9 family peptidase n=1 Tax=Atopobacter sp. AH10 TaxID=2315861 RepID=UPI000EF28F77|nr:S9 family peptidase [Atopobacter sp. AH10]RLK63362.1 S9 family peptidase [Atopobacter sp. AH10]
METITNKSLFALKNVSQPHVKNGLIYFMETQIDEEKNRYATAIKSLNLASSDIQIWGLANGYDRLPKLTKNGKYLAFLGQKDGESKSQIFVMATSGGAAYAVTDEKEGVSDFYISDNGARLYYVTSELLDSNEEKEKDWPHATKLTDYPFQWDGGSYVQPTRTKVKSINFLGGEAETVFEKDIELSLQYISEDEQLIIYTQLREDQEWGATSTSYQYDRAHQRHSLILPDQPKGDFYFLSASPSDRYYIFAGNDFEYKYTSQTKVYLLDNLDKSLKCLSKDLDVEFSDLISADFQQNITGVEVAWPDEEHFLIGANERGRSTIYQVSVKGEFIKLWEQPAHLTGSTWCHKCQSLFVTYSTQTIPSELGKIKLSAEDPVFDELSIELLYNPNANYLADKVLSTPERFIYKGCDDWDIEGWYLPPISPKNKDQHPAVFYVHGGPQVCYGESFYHEMQALAALGYGVIMLNPRGGNSYGQKFVSAILGDYGNKDYGDLMLGLDDVLNRHPEIDKDHIYLTGGSYGGYMTNWIVGHTDRFKAAVTQRCISNWISFYGTSDIGPFFVSYQLEDTPFTNREHLWSMSPLAYADKVKTPLLILHSMEDHRCPQEQGEQFYTALKEHGVEVEMRLYPKSSHGLCRMGLPNLRLDRLEAIQKWFQCHK